MLITSAPSTKPIVIGQLVKKASASKTHGILGILAAHSRRPDIGETAWQLNLVVLNLTEVRLVVMPRVILLDLPPGFDVITRTRKEKCFMYCQDLLKLGTQSGN